MLPSSPKCFLSGIKLYDDIEINGNTEPPLLASVGLRMRLLLLKATLDRSGSADWQCDSDGGYPVRLQHDIPTEDGLLVHILADDYTFNLIFAESHDTVLALGHVNYRDDTYPIPSTCLVIVLYKHEESTVRKMVAAEEVGSFEIADEFDVRAIMKKLKDDGIAIGFENMYL